MNGWGVDVDELRGEEREAWPGRFLSAADRRTQLRTRDPETDDRSASQHEGSYANWHISGQRLFLYERRVRKDLLAGAINRRVISLIREERERQEVSMNMLAQRSGLAQSTISRIEHGLRIPNIETLLSMCMVLEIDLGRIIQRAAAEVSSGKKT